MTATARGAVGAAAVLACIGLLGGCGGNKGPRLYPVSGQLLIGGKPAGQGYLVVLVPKKTEQETELTRSYGNTGPDGTFHVETKKPGDGAPEGEYVVTVLYAPPSHGLGGKAKAKKLQQVEKKYTEAQTSPLTARIEPIPRNSITVEIP